MDNVSAKLLLDRIRIACTTYRWTDETTAGNFKLALRGLAIDWINHTRDTLDVDISKWTNIEPEFIAYFNIKPQTVEKRLGFLQIDTQGQGFTYITNVGSIKAHQQRWFYSSSFSDTRSG